MPKISSISGLEIFDSRGLPTVEIEITLLDGTRGRAAVPSGASTGSKEALEKRDGGERLLGKGVQQTLQAGVEKIQQHVAGWGEMNQAEFDQALINLDATPNKQNLGANVILGASLAFARAAARVQGVALHQYFHQLAGWQKMSLPRPMFNVLNGGAHANNPLDIQEFMIVPLIEGSFTAQMEVGVAIYQQLKKLLHKEGQSTAVGDEGGFAPHIEDTRAALNLLMEAISLAGYQAGQDVALALDVAASEIFIEGTYALAGQQLSSAELVAEYVGLVDDYPIISIEDGMAEDDWAGWALLTKALGERIQLVGDDVFVTNLAIFTHGVEQEVANAILIKLNQIGTVSETLATMRFAHEQGYGSVISHRSGETEDTIIADFAVGTGAGQIKTGAPCRSERVAKYNQLLRIAAQLDRS